MEFTLPSLTQELEKFLWSPGWLSVYAVHNCQRLWPRRSRVDTLFAAGVCPSHIAITVDRNVISGDLQGYHEVELTGIGQTARNSMTLQRAPGPLNVSVKGDPTNFPFWPGGMEDPEIVKVTDESQLKDISNILTVPPGFTDGMRFGDHISSSSSASHDHVVPMQDSLTMNISELLVKKGALLEVEDKDPFVKREIEEMKILSEVNETTTETRDEQIDQMLHQPDIVIEAVSCFKPNDQQWSLKVDINSTDEFKQKVPAMAIEFPFELDMFQKQAILHLEQHESVFVAAHTSAGKTVVAEYAIALSKKHRTRVVYTSPIKALSNQKFRDFRNRFGEEAIGLLTGDVQIRTEAPCLIMTTEILRSMLYNGSDVIRDLEWVIFDEVHYVNDLERGVVWEEVLIMLPDHISVILLSATVPNAMEFADWVGRPVPLKHFLYTGNSKQTSDQLFQIVGADMKFSTQGYHQALAAKKERIGKAASNFGPKSKYYANQKQDKSVWLSLINMLQKKDKLPVVGFTFSRQRCNENADSLTTLDLTTNDEKSKIHIFFQKSVSLLKGSDQKLPQVIKMKDLLKRGIAVHHSGILPIIKEVVELLFQKGLVKLLFATETFAMGVNMPARTVVFDSTRKHDGMKTRDLFTAEYIQMAGRAGRRGLDDSGTVIILCKTEVPEASDLCRIILGQPTCLESQFRLTYSMMLNLMRVETLRVEDMMKRSFAEIDSARHQVDRQEALHSLRRKSESLHQRPDCPTCLQDVDQYYSACVKLTENNRDMQDILLNIPQALKVLSPGRVVVIYSNRYEYTLALILQQNFKKQSKTFTVLMLCNSGDELEDNAKKLVDIEQYKVVKPYQPIRELFRPEGVIQHAVVQIDGQLIKYICDEVLKVETNRIIEDYQKRQILRFREDLPRPATVKAIQGLLRMAEIYPDLKFLDPVQDLKVTSMEYVQMSEHNFQIESTLESYNCVGCPQFLKHFDIAREKSSLKKELENIEFMLSESSLQLLPEYNQRLDVLKCIGYISHRGTVELKGKVACELHSHEVLLTELLFHNIFGDFQPAEIAALLSSLVFQQAKCSEPKLTEKLKEGKKAMITEAIRIANTEHQCGLDVSIDDAINELKFGLTQVVYEWANGMEFVDITKLTDVSEGMIVRCIQRLNETCRDVCNAARVIGDPKLQEKMKKASMLIKRDIVFAASLYTI